MANGRRFAPLPIVSAAERQPKRVSWRPLAALCVCNAAHFFAICSIFSYAGIMTADLGWAQDRDHAGSVAGFLQSANVLGRMPTSGLWGLFADRYGFRPALSLSMLSLGLGGAVLGFCTTRNIAVAVRFILLGAGNGWTTFFGPISMELGGAERQVEVTGKIFAAGTVVQLLGPALGGWTYGWSESFPALVPNVVGAALSFAALVCIWAWIPDVGGRARGAAAEAPEPAAAEPAKTPEAAAPAPSRLDVLCTWPMPLSVALRSVQGFVNFSFLEVVPLWAISSQSLGGLALNERDIGTLLAVSAVGSGIFMVWGMPWLTKLVGLRGAAALGSLTAAVCLATMTQVTGPVLSAALHTMSNSGIAMLCAVIIACINNAVPSGHRATVNGVCVTLESLGKGVGPLGTSVGFAWTLERWGLQGHSVAFFALSAIHLALFAGIATLPAHVEGVAACADGGAQELDKETMSTKTGPSVVAPCLVGSRTEQGAVHYRMASEKSMDDRPEEYDVEENSPDARDFQHAVGEDVGDRNSPRSVDVHIANPRA